MRHRPDTRGAAMRVARAAWLVCIALLLSALPSWAQLSALVAPGPLSSAHAKLEGITNCQKCHTPGRELDTSKCLGCHTPIAERIARKTGVHRRVTGNCADCHAEHRGTSVDLRGFDTRQFDHGAETGFRLDGQHARLAGQCAACHKQRTFLDARPVCSSCHANPHKPSLGDTCTKCHSTAFPFKQTRDAFDHTTARFALTGAHRSVACEKCHAGGVFKGLAFDTCASCHKPPHRNQLGPACTACHVTDRWTTRTIEHSRTGFPLVGQHARVPCERCHTQGITRPLRADQCSSCHANPHRDSLKQDCKSCHSENGFKGAVFDHAARTAFPLTGRHEGLACRACHTSITEGAVPLASRVVDFGGLKAECASCHKDHHGGEFGTLCDACHRPTLAFKMGTFVHPRMPEFYAGRHAGLACAKCHVRPELQVARQGSPSRAAHAKTPTPACATCHKDVHLGQLGSACDTCHDVGAARFAPAKFSHDTGAFPLMGRHTRLECAKCHQVQSGAFPSGNGSARRFKPMSNECQGCHRDPHLGQIEPPCSRCHSTEAFRISTFTHRGLDAVFGVASHDRLPCASCHKKETGVYPAGPGTALKLKGLGRTCLDCH